MHLQKQKWNCVPCYFAVSMCWNIISTLRMHCLLELKEENICDNAECACISESQVSLPTKSWTSHPFIHFPGRWISQLDINKGQLWFVLSKEMQ